MTAVSRPAAGAFRLAPRLPGDKSITHRAFLLGALARGETRVRGANDGLDCRGTRRAVETLGATLVEENGEIRIRGKGGCFDPPEGPLDLGNSGTGLRLLLGLLAPQPFTCVLTGDASLSRRPVERVLAPLRLMGARADADGDHPPVTLHGGPLRGIHYSLPVPSAQVRSAILLAGLQASGTTAVDGGAGARDHTERLLPAFGIPVRWTAAGVEVGGPRVPTGTAVTVPGDPSAAAFYLTAAALVPGSEVTLEGVGINPLRIQSFEILKRMGLDVTVEPSTGDDPEPSARVRARGGGLRGTTITPDEIPSVIDELPVLAVAAAFASGETTVRGAGELRHKESDRLRAVADGITAMGGTVRLHDDGWTILGSGGNALVGGAVDPAGDHRIAMAFLIAGLATERGVELRGETGIETSDPHFLDTVSGIPRREPAS